MEYRLYSCFVGAGVNELAYNGVVIVSSLVKLNEYYLYNADDTKRQYTMCHELGHGFGLPHTDENPYNKDLGNCLDYTTHPENNLHPGQVNFNRLDSMYLQNDNITSGGGASSTQQNSALAFQQTHGSRHDLRRAIRFRYLYV